MYVHVHTYDEGDNLVFEEGSTGKGGGLRFIRELCRY